MCIGGRGAVGLEVRTLRKGTLLVVAAASVQYPQG